MKKNMKKFFVTILVLVTIFTSTFLHYENTKALGLEIALGAGIVIFVGGCCVACDILVNPDKYKDLQESMKDFGNATLENQKRLYEIEKSNFEYVMKQAVDAGVGSCIVGSDGKLYSAAQLQAQEYPSFDTWKGYKEKESEKPKKSMWDKFKLLEPFAGLLCDLFPDSSTGGSDAEDEQLYYTGDDGYIDRETGEVSFTFNSSCMGCYGYNYTDSVAEMYTDKFHASHTYTVPNDLKANYRIGCYVSPITNNYLYYKDDDGRIQKTLYKAHANVSNFMDNSGRASGTFFDLFSVSASFYAGGGAYTDRKLTGSMYSCGYYEGEPQLTLYDSLSCNLPIFDSREHFEDYLKTGSLVGLINGISDVAPSPTDAPVGSNAVSPVRQYVNYFSGTFSPSVMPYYVNYNIVNNYNYGDEFDINNYTGKDELTPTPVPTERIPMPTLSGDESSDGDTFVTNNILIIQTNILNNISDTVTNIYNFFQIDVDVIQQEMEYHFEEYPTGFDQLKKAYSAFETAFPSDKIMEGSMSGELVLYYPKITIKVPKALDRFLESGDDKIIMEDGLKKIVLCDFKDYAIHFVRFRKFLEIVLRIGLLFFILRELSVMFSIS